ncbi:efflux transporter outer membrane subunit [Novosphingobium sp. 9]|uniref:efflux transporter outer membrane subunit n=1 Tax=Novosphingobium sp. 9 TaxID=2025349 RepID=UPI0021B54315|nr:efflux transporter outer membrane subunit [Novosphingobium sp. 9]
MRKTSPLSAPLMAGTLLAGTLLASGCTVGPNYAGPPKVASAAAARGAFVRADDPAISTAPGLARWWETLNDPTLNALVDDALKNSPSIDLAQARIAEARGKLDQGKANLLPSVSASGSYLHAILPNSASSLLGSSSDDSSGSGSGSSGSDRGAVDFYNVGATASWEPDLFGGKRRGVEAARATVEERYADLADAQVSLTAQVAQTYVNLRDVENRAKLNRDSARLQAQSLDLTKQRYAAGTASKLDVERLQVQLENTNAQIVPLDAQIAMYKDALAVLTGRVPGALDAALATEAPVPLPPASVPIGDPAALIAHRPDIRSAERALAASTAQIGVNKAKALPGVSFYGILGMGGTKPGDVVDPDNLVTLLAPMINWSFLDFGRNAAAIRQSEAQRDQATAQYRQKVLEALQDAEDSLARFGSTRRQLAGLVRSEQSADNAASLNGQRYRAGTSTLIDQLDIERQQLSAQISVAQTRAQLTIDYIAVQKALGLGWSDPAQTQAKPQAAPAQ